MIRGILKKITVRDYCRAFRRGIPLETMLAKRANNSSSVITEDENAQAPLFHYSDIEAQNVEIDTTLVKMNSALYRFFGISGAQAGDILDSTEYSSYPPPPPQHYVSIEWSNAVRLSSRI